MSLVLWYCFEEINKFWCVVVQLELLGQSVYEFVHPCDQEELRDILTTRPGNKRFLAQRIFTVNWIVLWSLMCYWTCLNFSSSGISKKKTEKLAEHNFFLRMKSTLTHTGRTVNIKSANWKVHKLMFSMTVNDPNYIQTHKIATLRVSTCTAHQFCFY